MPGAGVRHWWDAEQCLSGEPGTLHWLRGKGGVSGDGDGVHGVLIHFLGVTGERGSGVHYP